MLTEEQGEILATYRCSTSARPPSCLNESLGTPWGLHEIAEKIGNDLPSGAILKGRVFTGQTLDDLSHEERLAENLITSRILWLRGLEEGLNAGEGRDSHDRYIYLHGTNREDCLGTPQSHGCVLLANADIIDLFERVDRGDFVWIEPGPRAAKS